MGIHIKPLCAGVHNVFICASVFVLGAIRMHKSIIKDNPISLILRVSSVGFSIFSLKAAKQIDANLLVLGEISDLGN